MEQVAANAERSSVKYKQVEFMADKIGQDFEGTISGVTQWGFYVELEDSKCEGLVSMTELDDDFYEFDEKNYCIVGRHHHKIYQLGDRVTIKVAKANLVARQLDYELVKGADEEGVIRPLGKSREDIGRKSKTKGRKNLISYVFIYNLFADSGRRLLCIWPLCRAGIRAGGEKADSGIDKGRRSGLYPLADLEDLYDSVFEYCRFGTDLRCYHGG